AETSGIVWIFRSTELVPVLASRGPAAPAAATRFDLRTNIMITITVHVSPADLRGVDFKRYASTLQNLIGETYDATRDYDEVYVVQDELTEVLFDGRPDESEQAADILAMAREITDPAVRDGYFD